MAEERKTNQNESIFTTDQWLMLILIMVTAGFGYLNWNVSEDQYNLSKEQYNLSKDQFSPDYMHSSYEPPLEITEKVETFFSIENVGNKRGHYEYYISSPDFWLSENGTKDRSLNEGYGIGPSKVGRIVFSIEPPEGNPKPEKTKLKISVSTSLGMLFEKEFTYHLVDGGKYILVK